MSDAGKLPALAIAVDSGGDREEKLACVRKLLLALQKHDEHAALDALETLIEDVTLPRAGRDEE